VKLYRHLDLDTWTTAISEVFDDPTLLRIRTCAFDDSRPGLNGHAEPYDWALRGGSSPRTLGCTLCAFRQQSLSFAHLSARHIAQRHCHLAYGGVQGCTLGVVGYVNCQFPADREGLMSELSLACQRNSDVAQSDLLPLFHTEVPKIDQPMPQGETMKR